MLTKTAVPLLSLFCNIHSWEYCFFYWDSASPLVLNVMDNVLVRTTGFPWSCDSPPTKPNSEVGTLTGAVCRSPLHIGICYRISRLDGHSHHWAWHWWTQDAAGVFWNFLWHVGVQLCCQLGQNANLKLHQNTQYEEHKKKVSCIAIWWRGKGSWLNKELSLLKGVLHLVYTAKSGEYKIQGRIYYHPFHIQYSDTHFS